MSTKEILMKNRLLVIFILVVVFGHVLNATPSDSPITPATMKQMLGRGFDCSWVEFTKNIQGYGVDEVIAHKAKGFNNARLRTMLAADATFFAQMDKVVNDCLNNGIIPIIAHNASSYETTPSVANMKADSVWWATVAAHYKDYSHKLVFNINIEWSDVGGKDEAGVNNYYAHITPGIRATNPTRIIIYSPTHLSDPDYLNQMVIPASAGSYVMAEWHLYAAGPTNPKDTNPNNSRQWTTGTAAEKKLITDIVNTGAAWEKSSGIPCWVGAWMAGDYNNGNTYPAAAQAQFASFMVSEFSRINVPWSINTEDRYYDYTTNKWIDSMLVVLNVLSPITNPGTSIATTENLNNVLFNGHSLLFADEQTRVIRLFQLDGRLVNEFKSEDKQFNLSGINCSNGNYLLVVYENNRPIYHKVNHLGLN